MFRSSLGQLLLGSLSSGFRELVPGGSENLSSWNLGVPNSLLGVLPAFSGQLVPWSLSGSGTLVLATHQVSGTWVPASFGLVQGSRSGNVGSGKLGRRMAQDAYFMKTSAVCTLHGNPRWLPLFAVEELLEFRMDFFCAFVLLCKYVCI